MKAGISPVVATITLIAIAVVTIVTTWYWVSAYTSKPAIAESSFKAYTITGVYKNASKTGCGAIDIKNTGGTPITNTAFYVKDYRTGKTVGLNGTDPTYPAVVNITGLAAGITSSFNISTPGVISFIGSNVDATGGSTAYDIAIGDPNNDGANEMVAAGEFFINMYKYTGGSWVKSNITNRSDFGIFYAVAVGDANNDGKQDIVAEDNYRLRIYENRSGLWVESNISAMPDAVESIAIGDANNDGKNDVVIGLMGEGNATRMYENKTGKWVETNITNIAGTYAVETVAIGDVNNNGKNETAIGLQYFGIGPNETRIYENTSGKWVETNISTWSNDINAIAIGDANNDGKNELIVGGYGNITRRLMMYENKSGGWVETNISGGPESAIGARTVAIGDADNDGLNETVIGLASTTNEVRMYKNTSGKWVETNVSDESGGVFGVAIGDANNDGANEIAVALHYNSPYEIRMLKSAALTIYLPLGTYVLRSTTPGFTDQLFTCA